MKQFGNTHRAAHPVPSVAIVGVGLVGSTTAHALLMSGTAGEIILIGRDKNRVEGHVDDLRDATLYTHQTRIIAGDYSDCATADVIIITVGTSQNVGVVSRLNIFNESAAILKDVIGEITRHQPKGVLLLATNPVDLLTYAAWKWSGLPWSRVIGSGTSLDSARFRRRLGEQYSVAAENVHACVLGEHGDSQVAMLSAARIAGVPLLEFSTDQAQPFDEVELRKIAEGARRGGFDIARNKGATYYGISAALTRITGAILRDEHAVLSVSTLAPEKMNLGSVCLSLPVVIARSGVCNILPVQMSDEEAQGLRKSAEILQGYLARLPA
jgi:L-lactate dehydrogenase